MMTFDAEQFRSYALYRRRYIPDECVHLKKDCIWYVSDDLILTSWKAIRPRDDIGGGISAFYPKLGFRISKVFAPDGSLVHWYNDICSVRIEDSEIHYTDLLLDVIVDPDGSLHLLDADREGHALLLRTLGAELVVRLLVPAGGGGRDQVPYTYHVVEVPNVVVGLGEYLYLPAPRIFSENAHDTAYLMRVYDDCALCF